MHDLFFVNCHKFNLKRTKVFSCLTFVIGAALIPFFPLLAGCWLVGNLNKFLICQLSANCIMVPTTWSYRGYKNFVVNLLISILIFLTKLNNLKYNELIIRNLVVHKFRLNFLIFVSWNAFYSVFSFLMRVSRQE